MPESTPGTTPGRRLELLQRAGSRGGQFSGPLPSPAVTHAPAPSAPSPRPCRQTGEGVLQPPSQGSSASDIHHVHPTVISGGDLARSLAGLQATSSYRKGEGGKRDPWQGTAHCPSAVGKCSMCKHFLKAGLRGSAHDGLIKIIRPLNGTTITGHPLPRLRAGGERRPTGSAVPKRVGPGRGLGSWGGFTIYTCPKLGVSPTPPPSPAP